MLQTAGRQLKITGHVVGPLTIKLGRNDYSEDVIVAPIQDDMLLGLDFMLKHGLSINLPGAKIILGEEEIPMIINQSEKPSKVSRITVTKRSVIPPNSVRLVPCHNSQPSTQFLFEPKQDSEIVVPRTLHYGHEEPHICAINLSNKNVVLKRGLCMGNGHEVTLATPVNEGWCQVRQTCTTEEPDDTGAAAESDFPAVLQQVLDKAQGNLTTEQLSRLANLLKQYQDVFAENDYDLGNFTALEHNIDTGTAKPVRQRMRRTPMSFAEEEKAILDKMLKAKVIQPSVSAWAAAPVLIRKRDGQERWCVDYRALNKATVKDVYPLPLIEECLDTLAGNCWFSKLDANSAYWQVKIKKSDQKKTAFVTKYGLFEFIRMGFGLCNAPATYCRVMSLVLRGLSWDILLAFLDDILVLGRTFLDHLKNLEQVFQRFRHYGLKLKPKKCELYQKEVEFLGRTVGPEGLRVGNNHIKAVQDWPRPTTTKHVQQFLGLVNYHRAFIKGYAQLAVPLYAITGKNKFRWTDEQESAFLSIKEALSSPPLLALPNPHDPFILDTDASDAAIGAEVLQVQDGQEKVIAYGSTSLSAEQRNYCTTRKELLAIIKFTRQYRHYLLGRKFLVRTDHSSLTWLLNFKYPQGQLARWIEELSHFDLEIQHRPGKKHGNADALSRLPEDSEVTCPNYKLGFDISHLPCGGCHYCARAHVNWSQFADEVDYVVPLSDKKLRPKESTDQMIIQVNRASPLDRETEVEMTISQIDIVCQGESVIIYGPGEPQIRQLLAIRHG